MEAASLRDAGLGRDGTGEGGPGGSARSQPWTERPVAPSRTGWRSAVREALRWPGWSWRSRATGPGEVGDPGLRDSVPPDRAPRMFSYVVLVTVAAVASLVPSFLGYDIGHARRVRLGDRRARPRGRPGPVPGAGSRRGGDRLPVDHVHVRAAASAGAWCRRWWCRRWPWWSRRSGCATRAWRGGVQRRPVRAVVRGRGGGTQPDRGCHRCRRTPTSACSACSAVLLAAVVWFAVNDILVTTAVWLRFGGGWRQTFAGHVPAGGAVHAGPARPRADRRRGREREPGARTADADPALHRQRAGPLHRAGAAAVGPGRPDRAAQPARPVPRDAVAGPGVRSNGATGSRATSAGWPCCCSTSTSSGTSTTRSGTRSGTGCSERSRPGWSSASAPTAWWPASAATSSRCWRRALADPSAANVLAERVADALAEPVTLDGLPLDVTAAIGVAIHPDHGTDHTTLLRRAEVAMYDAKHRAATYAIYSPESDHSSPERLELLAELRRALDVARPDEIQLYYQPQVDMPTGEVVGVEALLRWHHPQPRTDQPAAPDHGRRAHRRDAPAHLPGARGRDRPAGQVAGAGPGAARLDQRERARPAPAGAGRPARRPCWPTAACRPTRCSWRSPRAR